MIFFNIMITEYGDALACCAEPAPVIGNIKTARLVDIWNGKKHLELLKSHISGYGGNYEECRTCYVGLANTMPDDRLNEHAHEIIERLGTIRTASSESAYK